MNATLATFLLCLIAAAVLWSTVADACTTASPGSWHAAGTWTNCTGGNGLPGPRDNVTISNVVITIEAGKPAVVVLRLAVADLAKLNNHGTSKLHRPHLLILPK
jgi:hypothetical protein